MQGNVVENMQDVILTMTLAMPLDIVLSNGKPDGRFRIGAGPWQTRLSGMQLRVDKLDAALTPGLGPVANIKVHFAIDAK